MNAPTVGVWSVRASEAASLRALLSAEERERAARFRFEADADRFAAGRGALRVVLGHWLGLAPEAVRFGSLPNGKPVLAGHAEPQFNVSHSGEWALIAVAHGRRVGVDVERVRDDADSGEIARRYFSANEADALGRLSAEAQPEAFFRCWTRKEAYIKARGDGLSFPLDQFDVAFAPGEPPALLANRVEPEEVGRWSLFDLSAATPGYAVALAVEGAEAAWRWGKL